MASSDDNMLVESSRDFMATSSQHDVQFSAETNCGHSLKSFSFSFRRSFIIGTVLVIAIGFLSKSLLEPSLRVTLELSFDPMKEESFANHHNLLDAAPCDRSLKILADHVNVSSSPSEISSRESTEEVECRIVDLEKGPESGKEENALTDEKDANTTPMVRSVGQDTSYQGEEKPLNDIDRKGKEETLPGRLNASSTQQQVERAETNLADQSTTDSTKTEVSTQEEEKQSNLLPEDPPQEKPPHKRGKAKDMVSSNDERNTSTVETLLQQSIDSSAMKSNTSSGECNFTVGKWVYDPAGPLYRFDQCSVLSEPQNCQRNGRPDRAYEFYKWEPDHCSIPRFDPNQFLEMMRGKTLAFIGDSLARNQMESLMCILLQVAKATRRGGKSMHKWHFASHSFTLIRMWSSWLVQSGGDFPPSAAPEDVTKLNLTELDHYAQYLPTFDVTILSSGHWWLRKTAYFMNGEMLGGTGFRWLPSYGEMKLNHSTAYDIALNNTLQKIGSYPGYRGLTIWRTYTPDHYQGGSWNDGGSCTGQTAPYQEAPRNSFNDMMHEKQINIFKFNAKSSRGSIMPNGSKLRLLDIFPVLNYRGDGHPGPYRNNDPLKRTTTDSKGRPPPQDCLHWCMPGPLDTVNELLFHLLREEMQWKDEGGPQV